MSRGKVSRPGRSGSGERRERARSHREGPKWRVRPLRLAVLPLEVRGRSRTTGDDHTGEEHRFRDHPESHRGNLVTPSPDRQIEVLGPGR